jgi:hypothetical protein
MTEVPKTEVERRINEAVEIVINKARKRCGPGAPDAVIITVAVGDLRDALSGDLEAQEFIIKETLGRIVDEILAEG